MSDILTDLFHVVEEYAPEEPHDWPLLKKFTNTLTAEQLELFEAYQKSEFLREEADRLALFRFLLHVP